MNNDHKNHTNQHEDQYDRTRTNRWRMRRLRQFVAGRRQSCIHRMQALILYILFTEMAQDELKGNVSNVSCAIL